MADFRTHITVSSVLGAAYGAAGYLYLQAPPSTCVLAGGLCGMAGMLPDLDSDSGVPVREMSALTAAVVPMLMVDRFRSLGWSHEAMVVAGGATYFLIRFGLVEIFKRYTVHRGMWHSLPAAASCGLIAYLVGSCDDLTLRLYKTLAVVLGFLSHLVLDEIWAVDLWRARVKRSFGTAFKLWSENTWANVSTYAKLILLSVAAFYDPLLMQRWRVDALPANLVKSLPAWPTELPSWPKDLPRIDQVLPGLSPGSSPEPAPLSPTESAATEPPRFRVIPSPFGPWRPFEPTANTAGAPAAPEPYR